MRGLKGCLSVAVSKVALAFYTVLFLIIGTRTAMVTTVNRQRYCIPGGNLIGLVCYFKIYTKSVVLKRSCHSQFPKRHQIECDICKSTSSYKSKNVIY